MSAARVVDASVRAGFYDELLVRLAQTAARKAAWRRLAPGAAATVALAVALFARRRPR
jgi:hypothetical protein